MPNYSYQDEIIDKLHQHLLIGKPGVVLAATPGAGKTNMAIRLADKFIKVWGQRVLVLTHGQGLLRTQFFERLVENSFPHSFSELTKDVKTPGSENLHVALPHYFIDRQIPTYGLIVVDEAHHFFHGDMVQKVLAANPTAKVLCLTGTPSPFIASQKFPIVFLSAQQLLEYGTIVDPVVELVQTSLPFTDEDYNANEDLKESVEATTDEVRGSIDKALAKLISKTLEHLEVPISGPRMKYGIANKALGLFIRKNIGKTLVICRSQKQAELAHKYLIKIGADPLISTSDLEDSEAASIREFKTGESRFLVVVGRGILGFDYPELMNVVDIGCSLNPDRIFQALCRVIRTSKNNPRAKKLYIKVTPTSRSELTHHVMSFVMALSSPTFFETYDGRWKSIKVPKSGEIKPRKAQSGANSKQNTTKEPDIDLPRLYTFNDIKHYDHGEMQPYAWSTFTETRNLLNLRFWTDEALQEEALKYQTRSDFAKNSAGAYSVACQRSLLTEFCKHMEYILKPWTKETLKLEALKYQTRSDFCKGSGGAYMGALKRGILDEICAHMKANCRQWTRDELHQEALKYKTRKEFAVGSASAYRIARRRGFLDEICTHMGHRRKLRWETDEILIEARKYETRSEFEQKSRGAYLSARRKGLLKEACRHMANKKTWTTEEIRTEALRYKTRTEFNEGSYAYQAAYRRGILDSVCSHMPPSRTRSAK